MAQARLQGVLQVISGVAERLSRPRASHVVELPPPPPPSDLASPAVRSPAYAEQLIRQKVERDLLLEPARVLCEAWGHLGPLANDFSVKLDYLEALLRSAATMSSPSPYADELSRLSDQVLAYARELPARSGFDPHGVALAQALFAAFRVEALLGRSLCARRQEALDAVDIAYQKASLAVERLSRSTLALANDPGTQSLTVGAAKVRAQAYAALEPQGSKRLLYAQRWLEAARFALVAAKARNAVNGESLATLITVARREQDVLLAQQAVADASAQQWNQDEPTKQRARVQRSADAVARAAPQLSLGSAQEMATALFGFQVASRGYQLIGLPDPFAEPARQLAARLSSLLPQRALG